MELYKLNLGTTIRYRNSAGLDARSAAAKNAADGAECLMRWDWEAAVSDGVDGPRAVRPLPPPGFAGIVAQSGAEGGDSEPDGRTEELGEGVWLFCQDRVALAAGLEGIVEWFARESWWSGMRGQGSLFVRLVREDGKTAVQVLRRLASG